ncbi:aquaporin family protein [Paraburkholderia sp. CNPSo 3157]|uniref:Aquaporin family protein n=1 Tax=Paraburkholderia franconis TaxID=2654983 RepID=A0A7X1N518_9BURK|nr:MIP/aquaporin family protein [Paraburkholderia franconis]MPW15517.1 aquaporin family protein [Paraburkholderia franconis]
MRLRQAVVAEFLGSALLLATVVGSGIMGERLASGNVAIALLANTLATGAGLVALIATFINISGAHFNPLVTLAEVCLGKLRWKHAGAYIAAQAVGAIAGVIAAHGMFNLPLIETSHHVRTGLSQWWSEVVASFGLLTVILNVAKRRIEFIPAAVGGYITAAYWFTASTSFANPTVAIARSLTDTFAGIRPVDAPGFIVSELVGGALAVLLFRWMEQAHVLPGTTAATDHKADATAGAARQHDEPAKQTDEA